MNARLSLRHVMLRKAGMAGLFALAVIGAAAPAPAQNQQPSANAILIAKQIVQLKGVQQMMAPIAIGVVEKVKGVVMQTNFMWAKDINEVTAQMHKEFDGRSSEMVDTAARAYASHFTEPELKQILTFYQSPVGQKMVVEEPKAIEEFDARRRRMGGQSVDRRHEPHARRNEEARTRYVACRISTSTCSSSAAARAACAPRALPRSTAPA